MSLGVEGVTVEATLALYQDANLPKGWKVIKLEEAADINPRFSRDDLADNDEVSFIPMKAVEEISGKVDTSEIRPLEKVRKGYTYFEDGDVIFAKITPCMENGKTAVVEGLRNGVGFGSTEFHVARPGRGLSRDFLFYYLVQEGLRREAMRHMIGSAGQKRVPTPYFRQLAIPLPPLAEQHRIVEKLEELFTKLEAGVDALKKTQTLLGKYRQAVLKAAVTGELSREWREQHPDVEPASALLEQVLSERQLCTEAKQYKAPATPGEAFFDSLPSTWVQATVDALSYEVRYGTSQKTAVDTEGVPVLRMGNINDGQLVLDELKYLPHEHGEFPTLLLEPGDMLFNRTNSYELVGKTAVFQGTPKLCSFASYLIRVRFLHGINPHFVSYFINSAVGRAWINSVVSQQVGQANVNGTKLKAFTIALPPTEEQEHIVSMVEALLSAMDAADSIKLELQRAERLRQAILKQAFTGKLVPQHPDDEPASELLARIKNGEAGGKKQDKWGEPRRGGGTARQEWLFSE